MRKIALCAVMLLPLAMGGCMANAAVGLVSTPFKVAGQAADWATTSQEESDRNYGRAARKADARAGRERKKADRRCRDEDDNWCGTEN